MSVATPSSRPPTDRRHAPSRAARAGRAGTVAVLVAGLLVGGLARAWAAGLQERAARTGPRAAGGTAARAGTSLAGMDSFFLALLLGGLRGPLVMFLWSSSEAQKNEKDLEDFDTKVELIRLLQPEFDSVHLFQIWNKAYNVSAQLASLPQKYAAILDALDYARNVDAERPNNLNILMAVGSLYTDKLGGAQGDKEFYIRRMRLDTKAQPAGGPRPAAAPRQRHDPILAPDGNLLPPLTTAARTRPVKSDDVARVFMSQDRLADFTAAATAAGVALPPAAVVTSSNGQATVRLDEAGARLVQAAFQPADVNYVYPDWNNGAELQYLEPFQPFTDGVPPMALGYNYTKRAQVLMAETSQDPLQVSPAVLDSRPALSLRAWAEEEWQRAIEAELKAFARPVPADRHEMEIPTAAVAVSQPPVDPGAVATALFHYGMATRVARAANAEYARHTNNTSALVSRFMDYSSHVDHMTAAALLTAADADYLRAMSLPAGDDRRRRLERAAMNYENAITWYQFMDLRYYMPLEVTSTVLPPGVTRQNLETLRREAIRPDDLRAGPVRDAAAALRASHAAATARLRGTVDPNSLERAEYARYIVRAAERGRQIAQALGTTAPVTQPVP